MLLSQRKYAEHRRSRGLRGGSLRAVQKALESGRIHFVTNTKLIDAEEADAAWDANTDASKVNDAGLSVLTAPAGRVPMQPSLIVEPEAIAAEPKEEPIAPLTAARIRVTEEAATIKGITRRKLEGSLLEAEDVDRTWAALLQILKDRLRLIPDNIGASLAGCTDEAECRSIVMREILDAMGAMSKDIEGLAAA